MSFLEAGLVAEKGKSSLLFGPYQPLPIVIPQDTFPDSVDSGAWPRPTSSTTKQDLD